MILVQEELRRLGATNRFHHSRLKAAAEALEKTPGFYSKGKQAWSTRGRAALLRKLQHRLADEYSSLPKKSKPGGDEEIETSCLTSLQVL